MTRKSSAHSRSAEATATRAFNKLFAKHPVWAAVILVVVAAGAWFFLREGTTDTPAQGAAPTISASAAAEGDGPVDSGTDPVSGLLYIAESDLPETAQEILTLIHQGGPFEFDQDGAVFGNYEGLLPDESGGYYHEYTVQMPGDSTRGAHRFVTGDDGEVYWTDDHYASFMAVKENA